MDGKGSIVGILDEEDILLGGLRRRREVCGDPVSKHDDRAAVETVIAARPVRSTR
ncbi:MAG: hypothetical protein ACMVO3_08400 [Thalassobaculum sp.]